MKQEKSKSEQRREAIQKPSQAKEEAVVMTAVENTTMADGTFVAKGQKVEVPKEYAERVKKEQNKSFIF